MIGGKFHDKRGRIAGKPAGLFEHDAADDNGGHADKVCTRGNPCRAAENGACDHGDERNLRAAGDKGRGHDRHAPIAFIFNGTRCHDAGHAAACTDQHGDEGLARKTELAEDAVQHESNTCHITAGFQERQKQEEHQHLGNKSQHRADTGHNTVQNQALEPLSSMHPVQQTFQKCRNAGHPGSVCRRIRCADLGFVPFLHAQIFTDRCAQGFLVRIRMLLDRQRLLILCEIGYFGIIRHRLQQGLQVCLRVFLFDFRPVCFCKGTDDFFGVSVALCGLFILRCAVSEQMPAIPEQTVIGPVRSRRADTDHGNPVHSKHDQREDRQTQPAVGDHLVDFIRSAQGTGVMLPVAGLDDFRDVDIAFIGDDAFRVIIQFFFRRGNVLLNVFHERRLNMQLLEDFFIPLKHLDGVPSLLLIGHAVNHSFLNMRQGVFHRTGEGVHRNRSGFFRRLNGYLSCLHHAGALECGDFHNPAAQLLREVLGVDLVPVLAHHIHHVDRHNHRNAQFHELCGQIEVAFKIGAVHDIQYRIRTLSHQVVSCHHFFERIGRQAVNTRQVRDDDVIMLLQSAFLFFHRDARPVADKLIGSCQCIEQGCFAAVGIPRKRNSDTHSRLLLSLLNFNAFSVCLAE